ncbi:hypothetical protein EI74_0575 [Mycoplasma testudineum]|uniref:Uncharacterized protein n=2 Tax=Mycoplasma testudineum TaxID=244584 RepID=A0A4R6ICR4_9MOLU|nr:hypothetical protein [Mycoplasma testudineum]TDO19772.1 hypothetical protein EI74_0575 [Mycoplasma testudineum]
MKINFNKKYRYLTLFNVISVISFISLVSCNQQIENPPSSNIKNPIKNPADTDGRVIKPIKDKNPIEKIVTNEEIANRLSMWFLSLDRVDASDEKRGLKAIFNNNHILIENNGEYKFQKRSVKSLDIKYNGLFYSGFIDTIANSEILSSLPSSTIKKLFENQLIIENISPHTDKTRVMESTESNHILIKSFGRFKEFLSKNITIRENEIQDLGMSEIIKNLLKDKNVFVDELEDFNGINN